MDRRPDLLQISFWLLSFWFSLASIFNILFCSIVGKTSGSALFSNYLLCRIPDTFMSHVIIICTFTFCVVINCRFTACIANLSCTLITSLNYVHLNTPKHHIILHCMLSLHCLTALHKIHFIIKVVMCTQTFNSIQCKEYSVSSS